MRLQVKSNTSHQLHDEEVSPDGGVAAVLRLDENYRLRVDEGPYDLRGYTAA